MSTLSPATFIKYPRCALLPTDWTVADVAELSAVYEMLRHIPANAPLARSSHRGTLPPAASSLLMAICFTSDSLLPSVYQIKHSDNGKHSQPERVKKWTGFTLVFRSDFSLPVIDVYIFNSIQDYLYSAFYDTIVAKQLYRKLRFYSRFIYCRNVTYLTYGKMWLILYTVWGLASSEVLRGFVIISSHVFGHLRSFKGWIQTEACVIPTTGC